MVIDIIVGYFIIGFICALISLFMDEVDSLSEFGIIMTAYPFWASRALYRAFIKKYND